MIRGNGTNNIREKKEGFIFEQYKINKMKKYFLTIIGESKFKSQVAVDIGLAIGEIVDSKFLNFNYSESFIVFHFESSVNKEDMFTFIKGVLYGITDTFILTEMTDKFSVSLPTQLSFIFDLDGGKEGSKKFDIFVEDEEEDEDEVFENIMEIYRQNIKKSSPHISLDSLLDKINEQGINSLNETEKKILESYSK